MPDLASLTPRSQHRLALAGRDRPLAGDRGTATSVTPLEEVLPIPSRLFHAVVLVGVPLGTAACGGDGTQGGAVPPAPRVDAGGDTSASPDVATTDHDVATHDAEDASAPPTVQGGTRVVPRTVASSMRHRSTRGATRHGTSRTVRLAGTRRSSHDDPTRRPLGRQAHQPRAPARPLARCPLGRRPGHHRRRLDRPCGLGASRAE